MKLSAPLTLFFLLITLGVGCAPTDPKNLGAQKNSDTAAVENTAQTRCRTPAFAELERIFGPGNVTPTSYFSVDPYRTEENSCLYFGTVVEDKANYLVTVAMVPDAKQDYFTWEKTEAEVNKIFVPADENSGLPPGSFYKKLAILPEINFGRARKQEYSWSLVVHSNGITYSVTDVPQFVGMTEVDVRSILKAAVNMDPKSLK